MGSILSAPNPILSTDNILSPLGYDIPTVILSPGKMPNLRVTWYNPSSKTKSEIVYTFDDNPSAKMMISRTNHMLEAVFDARGVRPELLIDTHEETIVFSYVGNRRYIHNK